VATGAVACVAMLAAGQALKADVLLLSVAAVAIGAWYAGAGPAQALTAANLALQAEVEDRRRLEGELRQAQKLEAIGHLAGGVAHDFNNILMVIQGYADMLLAEAPDGGTMRTDLREIQEAARRGSDLTRQLLAFGRKQVLTIRPVDLNAVLADTSHMLTRLIGESIRLELSTATEACPIEADRVVGPSGRGARGTATAVRAAGRAASLPPTKGYFVSRPWSRVGVRSASVGLLVAGLIGGVYLGKDRVVSAPQQHSEASNVVQVDVDEMQLLKQRQAQHAAARAYQRELEGDAAAKAATEAKAAADKAHDLEAKAIAAKKAAADAAAKKSDSGSSGGPVAYNGPIPDSCNDFSGARKTGCALMLSAGFKIDQFPCLDKLFARESGWNYKATNSSSGAYGIPQALPGKKMAAFGSDWKTNPATQIKWGLDYIKNRYTSPCGAWSFWTDHNWY